MQDSDAESPDIDEKSSEQPSPIPADSADVIYLNNVKDKFTWNDQRVRREMERVLPEVNCRVKCIANGGIMFYSFKHESDVALVTSFDWNTLVDGAYPFGGGCKARRTKLTPQHVLNRTVRLVVPEDSSVEWVTERCLEEGFGECDVTRIGVPRYGKKVLKIVLPSEELANR